MSSNEDDLGGGRAALGAGLLLACHLSLLAYFAPRQELQSGRFVLNEAFAIEAYRALRARAAFDAWGTLSAYDPTVLAGQLAGITETFGTRVFVFAVLAGSRVGLEPARAFNGVIVALHAAVPLVAYGAARAFRLRRAAALVTMAFWIAIWFFDSLVHYSWFSGRIAWAVSAGVTVLGIGVGVRVAAGGNPRWAAGVVLLGLAALGLHPVAGLVGAFIVAGVAFGRAGLLPWRRALLASSALAPALVLPLLGGGRGALSSEPITRIFDVGVGQVLSDVLEISSNGYRAPGATRTMLRVLLLAGGVFGLARYRAAGDSRYAPLAATTALGTGVAYLGGYLPLNWPIDPYFFAVIGVFAASIPAAALLTEIDWRGVLHSTSSRAVVVLALAVGLPRLVRTVGTYMPEVLPDRITRSTIDLLISPLSGVKEPMPDRMRHDASPPGFAVVAEWFAEHHGGRGRILIDDASLAAYLAASATLPVLGPLGERGSRAAAADPTRFLATLPPKEDVARFLDEYGVGYVALWGAPSFFDVDDSLLEPVVHIAGVRIRRVVKEPSFFVQGSGRIQAVGYGRVHAVAAPEVWGSPPPSHVVLRFHYDRSLECRPGCRASPVQYVVPGGSGEFISIERPPVEFELVSTLRRPGP
jgi:hypothetical protein